MRAIAYYRVSTDEQAATGNGLDAQAAAVTAAIRARGWELIATLTDEGRSGGNLRRPALLDALGRLDRGEADVLVVSKLDRLSRSVLDFASITERAKRRGWSVVALDTDVDTTTPTGELLANITSSVAQWERRIIGARTAEAMQAMKARGVRLGRPVDLADDVRHRIAADHEAGKSLRAIAEALNTEAVPTARGGRWYASTVRAVLGSLALDADALAATA
jgi:DNA invertase Pin-like site-specific DNA recombinase